MSTKSRSLVILALASLAYVLCLGVIGYTFRGSEDKVQRLACFAACYVCFVSYLYILAWAWPHDNGGNHGKPRR